MSNVSWEDPPYGDRDAYQKLCETSTPSDFYFLVKGESSFVESPGDTPENFVMVFITPKLYFHKENNMWDQSNDLSECMESVWDNDGDRSVEEIRQDMLARGFEENEAFTKLINREYDGY
jgi:hypothetical protein